MNEYHERLIDYLLAKNNQLTYDEAQTWIELLWDDFETTSAKAGRDYLGSEMTERIVRQWIENYGGRLHDFIATNPKYKDFLNKKR
ncbi:YfhJ family protein [Bacillus salipaludis]|uniref:YfhJ family protein n=1 Tax=Bacillus salipaludis TaxID=2547811 RepID=UPI002E1B0CEA|nr:YfhJ family protein [Bacillus salipaludis]